MDVRGSRRRVLVLPTPDLVVSRTEAVIDGLGAPLEMRELLGYPLAKARHQLQRDPQWPVLHLPLRLGLAFGLSPDVAADLACACLLLYGFADLTDDAQDGDLRGDWGWERAVNAGFTLSFLGQERVLGLDLPAATTRLLAEGFAQAGRKMTFGQDGDLRAVYPEVPSIAAYMETITGKTGASVAYFSAAPAIAANLPQAAIQALHLYGESLGAYHQILSDLADYQAPSGRGTDARNRKLTLPLLYGLSQERDGRLRAWLEGASPDVDVAETLARLGAPGYCRMKAQLFKRKAQSALAALALPSELDADLQRLLTDPHAELRLDL